jgi:hypothetical protein
MVTLLTGVDMSTHWSGYFHRQPLKMVLKTTILEVCVHEVEISIVEPFASDYRVKIHPETIISTLEWEIPPSKHTFSNIVNSYITDGAQLC